MTFIIVQAWATGTTPMLLHRATEQALAGKTRSNNPGENDDPRIICEHAIYRLDNKQIAIPGAAFARMLREAGSSHKVKGSRKSVKYLVPAAMIILDDLCGLFLNDRNTPIRDFELDARPVTIPATKGRIMRYRARLNEWSCLVRLRINQSILDEAMIRKLMVEGLQQIGLGDFRPEKGGPFGTSDLVDWLVISEPKPLSIAQKRAAA